jgi:hypothetical protein
MSGCIGHFLPVPRRLIRLNCGSGGGEEPGRAKALRLIRIRLVTQSLREFTQTCQENSSQAQVADSSFKNAVSFSSACTTKRFPSSRCGSAIQTAPPRNPKLTRSPNSNRLCRDCQRLFPNISRDSAFSLLVSLIDVRILSPRFIKKRRRRKSWPNPNRQMQLPKNI